MASLHQSKLFEASLRPVRLPVLLSVFALVGYAFAQNIPEPIPGVKIPSHSTPWAVDVYEGKQQLMPIHHTNVLVNDHKGANIAGSLAGSFFYKPKMTIEINGEHARIALHSDKPVSIFKRKRMRVKTLEMISTANGRLFEGK